MGDGGGGGGGGGGQSGPAKSWAAQKTPRSLIWMTRQEQSFGGAVD